MTSLHSEQSSPLQWQGMPYLTYSPESVPQAKTLDILAIAGTSQWSQCSILFHSRSDSLSESLQRGTYLSLSLQRESKRQLHHTLLMRYHTPQTVSVSFWSSLSPWFESTRALVFPLRCIYVWYISVCRLHLQYHLVLVQDNLLQLWCRLTL